MDFTSLALRGVVEIDPEKRGGVPVIAGTRFTVSQLLAELAENPLLNDVCDDLDLPHETTKAMLHGLSIELDRPWRLR